MKKFIRTQHELNASVDAVWNEVKTGANWENWLPILAGSKVEGNTRTCDVPSPDGSSVDVMEESFLASNAEKTFVYQINRQQSFPASDIVGIIRLEQNGEQTIMHWSVEMSVESEEVFTQIEGQIRAIYGDASQKLEELSAAVAV